MNQLNITMKVKDITNKIKVTDHEPSNGFWFQHESAHNLSEIKILTYDELEKVRDNSYPIEDRMEVEDKYRRLTHTQDNKTFTYATPVKYHMFGKPDNFPGYTYYFKLTNSQVERCVFDVIDKKIWMNPTLGKEGLLKAISIFKDNKSNFKIYDDPEVGTIYPRIEVVIPFIVTPSLVFPQEEDR